MVNPSTVASRVNTNHALRSFSQMGRGLTCVLTRWLWHAQKSLHTAGPLRRTTRRVGEPRSRGSHSNTCHDAHKTFSLKWQMQLAKHCERYGCVGNRSVAFGTKRKCWNAAAISGAGGRPAVPSACRPRRPLTQLGNEDKYYGADQLGSAIFLAHALLPRVEI